MIDGFDEFIDWEHKRLIKYYGDKGKDLAFPILAKLMEEVGELSEAVLKTHGFQRPDKLKNFSEDELAKEFADCMFVLNLLAKDLNVDVKSAIEKKISIIKERDY